MTKIDAALGPTWLRELLSAIRIRPPMFLNGDSSATGLQTYLFGYCACLVYHGEAYAADLALLDAFEVWLKEKYAEAPNAGWSSIIEAYAAAAATGIAPSWMSYPVPTIDSSKLFFQELDEFLASRGDSLPARPELLSRFFAPLERNGP